MVTNMISHDYYYFLFMIIIMTFSLIFSLILAFWLFGTENISIIVFISPL